MRSILSCCGKFPARCSSLRTISPPTPQDELDCSLSPNLTYALADHLNFAIQRCRDGIVLQTPLAYDIRHLYRRNTALQSRPCTSSGILCTLSCPTRKL